MNAIMENLLTRRSTRAFQDKEIPRQELEQILKAAQYAPSAKNLQTWQFTVGSMQPTKDSRAGHCYWKGTWS